MERLYFTFGSDSAFPHGREDYMLVIGKDRNDIFDTYKKKYPNRDGSNVLNCADYYTQSEWDKESKKYFGDKEPAEILVSETLYGRKPEGFASIWLFIPSKSELLFLQEGSGDNLLPEDEEEGNVDYLDYTCFMMDCGEVSDGDGGQLMLPYMVQEHYGCLADAIPDILEFAYDDMFLDAVILKTEEE